MTTGAALVVGVGPALGAALGRRFAKARELGTRELGTRELGTARTRDSVKFL